MSDWPPKPQNEPTNSNNVTGKEWQILEKAVLASVEEQRRSRRWSIFFKCLGFAYLLIVLIAMSKGCSTSVEKSNTNVSSDHLAVIDIVGTIDSSRGQSTVNSEDTNKELNRAVKEEQAEQATVLYSTLRYLTNILGLVQYDVEDFLKSDIGQEALNLSDVEIEDFIQQRVDAKKAKDFAKADSIRQSLLDQGVVLEDTRQGTIWRRAD